MHALKEYVSKLLYIYIFICFCSYQRTVIIIVFVIANKAYTHGVYTIIIFLRLAPERQTE